MKTLAKVASASFAHLAGLGRSKAAKAEDDDEKKDRDHEDVNDGAKKGKKAEDDEPEKKDDEKKSPDAKAEDDDPDAKASDDDKPDGDDGDEDDDKKSGKAKKAKAEDGDEDDEKMRAGAMKERARCAAIFASPAAARNVQMAAKLAFSTDLTSAQAIEVLQAAPAATAHPNRAAGNPRIGAAGAPEITGKQAVDSSWDRAFAQVNPQKRK